MDDEWGLGYMNWFRVRRAKMASWGRIWCSPAVLWRLSATARSVYEAMGCVCERV